MLSKKIQKQNHLHLKTKMADPHARGGWRGWRWWRGWGWGWGWGAPEARSVGNFVVIWYLDLAISNVVVVSILNERKQWCTILSFYYSIIILHSLSTSTARNSTWTKKPCVSTISFKIKYIVWILRQNCGMHRATMSLAWLVWFIVECIIQINQGNYAARIL